MKVFISYSHKDQDLFSELELRLRGLDDIFPDIDAWSDQRIQAGDDWHGEIQAALNAAQVVLLLVSPEFKASRYIREHELEPALARHARGECVVAPVIVRSTPFWDQSAFAHLQALPTGGKHVKSWPDPDEAWTDVVTRLMAMAKAKGLLRQKPPPKKNAVFHVPFPRNPYFAGRAAELEWLRKALGGPGRRVAALLAGIGGVGKTSTAAEYAHSRRDDYRVIWWVEAETAEGRDLAFANLAAALRLPGCQSPKLEEVRAVVHKWLAEHDDWLLIFDNAEAPADLKGWLPTNPAGHALITSRNPAWGIHAQKCAVTVWDAPTAAAFLLERSGCNDDAAAMALAEKLGGLPLACEQAGAYIEANGVSFRTYIKQLDASLADMLDAGAAMGIHPFIKIAIKMLSINKIKHMALVVIAILFSVIFIVLYNNNSNITHAEIYNNKSRDMVNSGPSYQYTEDTSIHNYLKYTWDSNNDTSIPYNHIIDTTPNDCDILAAEFGNPYGIKVVAYEKINIDLAIPACEASLKKNKNDLRRQYQLGRVYLRAKRSADAIELYYISANNGYAPAQNSIAKMLADGAGNFVKKMKLTQ